MRGAGCVADIGEAGGEFAGAGRPQAVGVAIGVGGEGFPGSVEAGDLVVDEVELFGQVAGEVRQAGDQLVEPFKVDGEFRVHRFRLGNCWAIPSSVVS